MSSADPQRPQDPRTGTTTGGPATHDERLWPGPGGWAAMLGFAAVVLVALLPVEPRLAVAVAGATAVVGVVLVAVTAPRVRVAEGVLRAGRAHIPVGLLGVPAVLDRDGVRQALGPGSDARAYACFRSWVAGAVEVPVTDPADPTPTWLVSSRRPEDLRAALVAEQRRQAAHSEQIG
ncbi:DUF3093 domain-containing protein [Actinotalea sp. AC32]|nr:DUF3093 domain-containing protein [Actinotalea sp. AC32]